MELLCLTHDKRLLVVSGAYSVNKLRIFLLCIYKYMLCPCYHIFSTLFLGCCFIWVVALEDKGKHVYMSFANSYTYKPFKIT